MWGEDGGGRKMIAIKDMKMPIRCYECPFAKNKFAKNKKTNDYGFFCECGLLEKTINLLKHSRHPNCPLIEQEPNIGHWKRTTDKAGHLVWECKCGWQQRFYTKYCPDCGVRMEGEGNLGSRKEI